MNLVTYAIAAVVSLTPFTAIAASTQANSAAEAKLWAFSEEIALNLPGHSDDVSKIVSGSAKTTAERLSQGSTLPDKEIGPSLFTRDSAIVMGAGHRADSVSFNLSGSCVPVASLRSRYPSLIVMDYARGDSEHATYTFGAQVGDAIIAYSFPAKKLNCMNRVEITPAAVTKARLRMK
ncbi:MULTISPECIES: hypothetical protein [unclassified Stenotrophomonas]|uniref:hypothetical protein n=1 Tax=unclassified Stenotrophomonas TaxID=196198 RepID=UPI0034671211